MPYHFIDSMDTASYKRPTSICFALAVAFLQLTINFFSWKETVSC